MMNSLTTITKFLLGNRDTILQIAQDRRWLKVGFLFVIAAGLAREYDAEYLIAEPWYLAIPIAASVVASFLLYCLVYALFVRRAENRPTFRKGYGTFLRLFWLTAPLALLYGIPVERFMAEYNAAVANLWFLAVVALWRVLLVTRVVSVLTGVGLGWVFFPVMLFADLTLLAGLGLSPHPIISFMGGVRGSPTESLIASLTLGVGIWAFVSGPLWILVTLTCIRAGKPSWLKAAPSDEMLETSPAPSSHTAIVSMLVWIFAMPWTQPEQRLRWKVDRELKNNRIADALDMMSSHPREQFPPHFDPRPRNYHGQSSPEATDVMEILVTKPVPEWVRTVYINKLKSELLDSWGRFNGAGPLSRVVPILEQMPEGNSLARELTMRWDYMDRLNDAEKVEEAPYALRLQQLANSE